MLNNHKIIDADCHVTEPIELWEQYLEPEFQPFVPIINATQDEHPLKNLTIQGQIVYDRISDQLWVEGARLSEIELEKYGDLGTDPESQVKAMQRMGTDVAFLYPTVGLWVLAMDAMSSELSDAYTRAYNNWLHDFCSFDSKKLRGVAAISLHSPETMALELQRIADWGWKTVFLRPNPVHGRLLNDPSYEPFWGECARLGVSVSIHEGSHSQLPTIGSDRFSTRFARHACSHPMELMTAFLALLEGGVLERHSSLKFAFLEAGCGWLPYWMWRLDEEYEQLRWEVAETVKMKPSDYFRRQCYVSIEPSEPYLKNILDFIGSENLLFGSDYPHIDYNPEIVGEMLALEDFLSNATMKKILWENPSNYYSFCK
ncbi:MAG: amidohydrolase [Symploca sp. SIO3C6]|nr:amidohydrolase [Symploca sp. SIO3C6]